MIIWVNRTQPLNSSVNYLTNCREIALVGIKNQNQRSIVSTTTVTRSPTRREELPSYPEKSAFIWRIDKKHSNENDVVLDTFLGAGTTTAIVRTPNEDLGVRIVKGLW
jgi:site-specific DNA-methyltransferase (adenine-specific)